MEISMMKKTKQTYVQLTCEVVELHVTNQLLARSGDDKGTGTQNYNWNEEETIN